MEGPNKPVWEVTPRGTFYDLLFFSLKVDNWLPFLAKWYSLLEVDLEFSALETAYPSFLGPPPTECNIIYILPRATSLRAPSFGGVRTWVEGLLTWTSHNAAEASNTSKTLIIDC